MQRQDQLYLELRRLRHLEERKNSELQLNRLVAFLDGLKTSDVEVPVRLSDVAFALWQDLGTIEAHPDYIIRTKHHMLHQSWGRSDEKPVTAVGLFGCILAARLGCPPLLDMEQIDDVDISFGQWDRVYRAVTCLISGELFSAVQSIDTRYPEDYLAPQLDVLPDHLPCPQYHESAEEFKTWLSRLIAILDELDL